jgi:competence protein ComEC
MENRLDKDISLAFSEAKPMSTPPEATKSSGRAVPNCARITVFDVGQGDGILLVLPNGEAWLVDAYFPGSSSLKRLLGELKAATGSEHIQRLVISHFHLDHILTAEYLVGRLDPEAVVVPRSLKHRTAATRNLLKACHGVLEYLDDRLRVSVGKGVDLTIVPTAAVFPQPRLGRDPNNHALVIGIASSRERHTALLSGDLGGDLLDEVVPYMDPWLLGTESGRNSPRSLGFYKVTHHCSKTGDYDLLLQHLNPSRAATSCARYNRFKHPYPPLRKKIDDISRRNSGQHLLTFDHGDIRHPPDQPQQ